MHGAIAHHTLNALNQVTVAADCWLPSPEKVHSHPSPMTRLCLHHNCQARPTYCWSAGYIDSHSITVSSIAQGLLQQNIIVCFITAINLCLFHHDLHSLHFQCVWKKKKKNAHCMLPHIPINHSDLSSLRCCFTNVNIDWWTYQGSLRLKLLLIVQCLFPCCMYVYILFSTCSGMCDRKHALCY